MEINGKTYRNLESQVGYLTDVAEQLDARITEVAAQIPSKMIVEELPETGDPLITYYVGPKGTDPDYYYEVWVWVQEEPDGPFVWRELEDTDQVDLSGYLEKVETATTYSQLYAKHADGGQIMFNVTTSAVADAVVKRTAGAQVDVPYTPTAATNATSKDYVDTHCLAKDTTTTPYAKVYIKKADGTQDTTSISSTPNQGFIVQYNTGGTLRCKDPTGNGEEAVNLSYANDHYLAKQTGSTTYQQAYFKNTDGSQTMINANSGVIANSVVLRDSNGRFSAQDPNDTYNVATKHYVDAAVGQLIYHHDMVIQYTLTGDTDYVKIAAHSDNNGSTAYTAIDWHNMPLIMPDYAMYHYDNNDYLASVTKLPRGLHQDEFSEPRDGFLLTYWDGSAFQNVRVNSNIFNVPTVTDVVTTW